MNIFELQHEHLRLIETNTYPHEDDHAYISIRFAIDILKSLDDNMNGRTIYECINDKILELKKAL